MIIHPDRLGRGRQYADLAAEGQMGSVVDEGGDPIAHIIPATEPITDALIDELKDTGAAKGDFLEFIRNVKDQPGFRYQRAGNAIIVNAPVAGPRVAEGEYDSATRRLREQDLTFDQLRLRGHKAYQRLEAAKQAGEVEVLVEILAGAASMLVAGPIPGLEEQPGDSI